MKYQEFENCAVRVTVQMIGGKWKCLLIYMLKDGPIRFVDLWRSTPKISKKVLLEQLAEMQEDELVFRVQSNDFPPQVDYGLTEKGYELVGLLQQVEQWGLKHVPNAQSIGRFAET